MIQSILLANCCTAEIHTRVINYITTLYVSPAYKHRLTNRIATAVKNICSSSRTIVIVSVTVCNCIVYEVNALYPLITSCYSC